jgi:hypothetical protein
MTNDADACVDCSSQQAFDAKCAFMADDWVIAAQDKCGLSCTGRCPTHSDSDCNGGGGGDNSTDLVCVVQTDGYFDQCVDCTPDSFEEECKYWSTEIRSAAEIKCGLTCELEDGKDSEKQHPLWSSSRSRSRTTTDKKEQQQQQQKKVVALDKKEKLRQKTGGVADLMIVKKPLPIAVEGDDDCANKPWDQCAGEGFTGSSCW